LNVPLWAKVYLFSSFPNRSVQPKALSARSPIDWCKDVNYLFRRILDLKDYREKTDILQYTKYFIKKSLFQSMNFDHALLRILHGIFQFDMKVTTKIFLYCQ
jgi:hypothetical protein